MQTRNNNESGSETILTKNIKMYYISTRPNEERISFREAVLNGLSTNGGLYLPANIPLLPSSFFKDIEKPDDKEIAFRLLKPFVGDSLNDEQLMGIISRTLSFPIPVVKVEKRIYSLELFHGPTQAFKDVGAMFMSGCLSHFEDDSGKKTVVLVATSGDTGSAVAHGFYRMPGISVKILFPKGKISPYQEYQICSLGENIEAIEVNGNFDDCQTLVKMAFEDKKLQEKVRLSSANSINIARLLPQMLYYFFAYKQLKALGEISDRGTVVSVPSGNLGNLTAGLIAKKMGLPIKRFVASNNSNDTFTKYIETGKYSPKASVQTYSNAMDVGAPSNIERIHHIYKRDNAAISSEISAYSFSDEETLTEIASCYSKNKHLLDPHSAIGKLGLQKALKENETGIFLATASPKKFSEVISMVIQDSEFENPDLSACTKTAMDNDIKQLIDKIA